MADAVQTPVQAGVFCRQCQGDLINDLDGARCGTCGLPAETPAVATEQPMVGPEGKPQSPPSPKEAKRPKTKTR